MSPEQIARSLTKAQREALLKPSSNNPAWLARTAAPTARVLNRLGLTDWADNPARFTSLGLSVRAIIQASEGTGQ